MKKDDLIKDFNKQINEEIFSAYLYLSMSAYFLSLQMDGFARWLQVQTREEMEHAMKFFHFLDENQERILLSAVQAPVTSWKSPQAAFEAVLQHEKHVSGRIHKLYQLALQLPHYPAQVFLQWFIKEQVEEENNADKILNQLKSATGNVGALMMLDQALGARQ